MLLLPVGHEKASVRRLPWVTIGIALVCLVVQFRTSAVEPDILAEAERVNERIEALHESFLKEQTRLPRLKDLGVRELDDDALEGAPQPGEDAERAVAEIMQKTKELERERDRVLERLPTTRLGYRPARDGVFSMISSAFAHGGWMHLLGNLLFLYLVGCNMEDRWGRLPFSAFYFAGALTSALAFKLWHPDGTTVLVGASGAIAALMGAFAVCYSQTKIRFFYFYWLFFRPRWGTFLASAWVALPLWFLEQAFMSFFEASADLGVAYSAHVGGFVLGVAVAIVLRVTGKDAQLLEAGDAPERPEDVWSEEPLFAEAEGLARDGHREQALAALEQLFVDHPDHERGRELAFTLALDLGDDQKLREHTAATFTHWTRRGLHERVVVSYRALRESCPELEPSEAVLKAVVAAAARKDADPLVAIDVATQLILRHPHSLLLPRAMWAAAEAQERLKQPALAERTLHNIVATFPMDPIADQARRKLNGQSIRPPR